MTKLDHVTLSDEAARFAVAQVAAGRFRSIDDVLAAGVEALQERDEREEAWLETARDAVDRGRAAFARGETIRTTPEELMDGINRELGIAD